MYPRSSYIIYSTQRTGSFLLCEALNKTKLAGRPREYFTPGFVKFYAKHWEISLHDVSKWQLGEDYFRRMYATATPNGVFGVKIIWHTFAYCLEQIRILEGNEQLTPPELLQTAFPQHRTILTTRRDKVRQAISWWKASKTGIWGQRNTRSSLLHEETPQELEAYFEKWAKGSNLSHEKVPQELEFNFAEIERFRKLIVDLEFRMDLFFFMHDIEPFTVVYEDFASSYEETTLQVLDYLRIPVPRYLVLGEPLFQKQADEQTEEWVQRYYQTKQLQESIAHTTLLQEERV
jgi:trehalose 2-sulfotransferase